MQVISSIDFQDWKKHPVTLSFLDAVSARIEDAKNALSTSAGLDSNTDNFMRGFIQGQREILDISYDDVEDKE